MIRVTISAFALLALAPAAGPGAPVVTVDFDRQADFSRYATYRWVAPSEAEEDPLADQRIVSGVDFHLSLLGLRRMSFGEPDLLITYHADASGEVSVDAGHFGFRFGAGWYWGGGPVSTASEVQVYPRGTLVLDMWEAKGGWLVWRGSAENAVRAPTERVDEQLAAVFEALFARFPPRRDRRTRVVPEVGIEPTLPGGDGILSSISALSERTR